ncbi:MAG: DUF421 domain-containing protein [Candidatus Krumholzibacteriia bacterium]
MGETLELLFGSEESISWYQMCLRAVASFCFALILVRAGGTRAFGKNTSFDIVLGVILGSVISRAVTGNSPMIPTFAAAIMLVLLHLAFTSLAFRWSRFGAAIKGSETRLVAGGEYIPDAMRRTGMTPRDIAEGLRESGHGDLAEVEAVYLERSGNLSVIPKD